MIILKIQINPIDLTTLSRIEANRKVKVEIEVEPKVKDGEVCIPDGATKLIKFKNVRGCPITNVRIPETVTMIGSNAFEWCTELTSLQIPSSIEEIGRCAFLACTNLESIEIPDSVTKIGEGVFWACDSLREIVVPVGTLEKFKKMLDPKIHHLIVEK